ncbi:hypothetical protein MBLNU230_g1899t1 [Neophaeotheca triangularis]
MAGSDSEIPPATFIKTKVVKTSSGGTKVVKAKPVKIYYSRKNTTVQNVDPAGAAVTTPGGHDGGAHLSSIPAVRRYSISTIKSLNPVKMPQSAARVGSLVTSEQTKAQDRAGKGAHTNLEELTMDDYVIAHMAAGVKIGNGGGEDGMAEGTAGGKGEGKEVLGKQVGVKKVIKCGEITLMEGDAKGKTTRKNSVITYDSTQENEIEAEWVAVETDDTDDWVMEF